MMPEVSYSIAQIARILNISKGNARKAFRDMDGVTRNDVGYFGVMRVPESLVVAFAARHGYPRPRKGTRYETAAQLANSRRDSACA